MTERTRDQLLAISVCDVVARDKTNFEGIAPESWHCVDCGANTAPGCFNRAELESAAKALGESWETNAATISNRVSSDSEDASPSVAVVSPPASSSGCRW